MPRALQTAEGGAFYLMNTNTTLRNITVLNSSAVSVVFASVHNVDFNRQASPRAATAAAAAPQARGASLYIEDDSRTPNVRISESIVNPASLEQGDVWLQGSFDVNKFGADRYTCEPGWEHPYHNFSLWPCRPCATLKHGSAAATRLASRLNYTKVSKGGGSCAACPNGYTGLSTSERSECERCPFGTRGDKDGGCDPCAPGETPANDRTECSACTQLMNMSATCAPSGSEGVAWLQHGDIRSCRSCGAATVASCVDCTRNDHRIGVRAGWAFPFPANTSQGAAAAEGAYAGYRAAGVAALLRCPRQCACLSSSYDPTDPEQVHRPACNTKALGVTGLLCGLCDTGWYRSGRHACSRCDAEDGASRGAYIAGGAAMLLAVGIYLYVLRGRGSSPARGSPATSELSERINAGGEPAAGKAGTAAGTDANPLAHPDAVTAVSGGGMALAGDLVLDGGSALAVVAVPSRCRTIRDLLELLVLRLSWFSSRIVLAMCQVLTQLHLAVAKPLNALRGIFSVDVGGQVYHFECHGYAHSYYRAWWLNTVGQLLIMLVLLLVWATLRSRGSGAAFREHAASGAFLVVFMWRVPPPPVPPVADPSPRLRSAHQTCNPALAAPGIPVSARALSTCFSAAPSSPASTRSPPYACCAATTASSATTPSTVRTASLRTYLSASPCFSPRR